MGYRIGEDAGLKACEFCGAMGCEVEARACRYANGFELFRCEACADLGMVGECGYCRRDIPQGEQVFDDGDCLCCSKCNLDLRPEER